MSLPSGTYQPFEITYLDAGNEKSSFSGYSVVSSAGNLVAQSALFATLVAATDAIVLGTRTQTRHCSLVTSSAVPPINGAAREIKLLIQWQNQVNGRKGVITVPTINPAIPDYVLNINARDVVLLTSPAEITAFIDAFEAFAVDPVGSGAITVVGLKVVGRNI